jgi:hypothetical protein
MCGDNLVTCRNHRSQQLEAINITIARVDPMLHVPTPFAAAASAAAADGA